MGKWAVSNVRQQSLRVLFKYEGTFTREFHDVGGWEDLKVISQESRFEEIGMHRLEKDDRNYTKFSRGKDLCHIYGCMPSVAQCVVHSGHTINK